MRFIIKTQVVIIFLCWFFVSCSPERKLSVSFANRVSELNALIIGPDYIFKNNQKTELLDSLGIIDETLFDSVLLANSLFLNQINDSLFISNYIAGFTRELKVFGFKVFTAEHSGDFLEKDINSFVVNIAQLQLEEGQFEWTDETQIYDSKYTYSHNLNAVYINSWIEIGRINTGVNKQELYYATDLITDKVEGEFNYDIFSQNIQYMYNYDTIQVKQLYEYAYTLGRTYAGYTFDLLLNNYLNVNLPAEKRSDRYWRYDPIKKVFFPAEQDRFIPLEKQ